jgi:predicted PurR-regulated permease PerM
MVVSATAGRIGTTTRRSGARPPADLSFGTPASTPALMVIALTRRPFALALASCVAGLPWRAAAPACQRSKERVVRSPEPQPPADAETRREAADAEAFWSFAARFAIVGIFVILLGAVLVYARPVLLPVVSAIVIGTMLGPLERRALNWHIPTWAFALMVIIVLLAAVQGAAILLSGSIIAWIEELPRFADAFRQKLQFFNHGFTALRDIEAALSRGGGESVLRFDVAAVVQGALGFLTPAMGEILIFFATLFFFLFSRTNLRKNLILAFEEQDVRLRVIRVLNGTEAHLTRYLGTVTVINIGVGVVAGIGAQLLGLPNPLLIGVLACVFNYVPYIGPAFMVLILFAVSLIHYPLFGQAFIPPLLFVVLTTIEGHIITPNIVGQRLTLNPFAVFLGLTVWTWMWGPVGAFLSVPFLIVALVVIDQFSDKDDIDLPG